MKERIKELRKALGLSGEKFGEPLGVQRNSISQIETGKNNLTEQMIKLICLTYNVNEDWLRTGNGSMFNETDGGLLADLRKEFKLNEFQLQIVKAYLELNDKEKSVIDKFIASCNQDTNDNWI